MPFIKTDIPDLLIYEPVVFEDHRGYFMETYNEKTFSEGGFSNRFVQDNQARSCYGVIRGLHYQLDPHAQTKLVRVLSGAILDVAVDIRKGSPTYGKVFSIEITADNKKQLLIPRGFAHGYSVLSQTADVLYKCDNSYQKSAEGGILYNDPFLQIDWGVPADKHIVAEKDLALPVFSDCLNNFTYSK